MRKHLEYLYAKSYKREYPNGDDCAYCGDLANSEDHIPSLHILHMLVSSGEGDRYKRIIVPSCMDCNSRLGSCFAFTISKRKKILHSRLKKKYKKILRKVVWDDDETESLGYSLRKYIEHSQAEREIVLSRLRFLSR